jgi:hypothetical protein
MESGTSSRRETFQCAVLSPLEGTAFFTTAYSLSHAKACEPSYGRDKEHVTLLHMSGYEVIGSVKNLSNI